MRYIYSYQTIVRFSQSVNSHFLKLRCLPCVNSCQKIVQSNFMLHPTFMKNESYDTFGNHIIVASSLELHDSMAYISSGIVELDEYRIPEREIKPYYFVETLKTAYTPEMEIVESEYYEDKWQKALALCVEVYRWMHYEPNITDMSTTAGAAFAQRRGVCQDYAHILIALCRHYGIAARYVNGFIAGEGQTHAWVEVYVENEEDETTGCWRGLDPTHGIYIEYGYIKLAHGRDADDCSVSRGVYTGSATQKTEIRVVVNEL